MQRPTLLVGLDAPPARRSAQDRRLRALSRSCEIVLCAARPAAGAGFRWTAASADAFRVALARAAQRESSDAVLLLDGPAVRATLRQGRFDGTTRVALWADAESHEACVSDATPRRPGAARRPEQWPDELWWTGSLGEFPPNEFVPGNFRNIDEASIGPLAARFASPARAGSFRSTAARGLTTIVVPCWNGLADTRLCLSSVLRHTREPFELVVVDNGSSDGTARYVRSLRDRRVRLLVNGANLGFARAINRGLAAARGSYAVWLNNDCIVTPGWLKVLIGALERAPWIGAVGPMTDSANGLQLVPERRPISRQLHRFAAARALAFSGRMTWAHRLIGFCLLHRTELLRRVGFLDERFGIGCYEDFDWSLRVRQAGYELYVAEDAFVAHRGHASFTENRVPREELLRRNRGLFVDKWCRQGLEFLDELDDALEMRRIRSRRREQSGS